MLKAFKSTDSQPNFSIPKGKSINAIISFIEEKLPLFSHNRQVGLTHEDEITQDCCIFLNREARETFFMFQFQYKYIGKQRSSDMSIISALKLDSQYPLLVIEAKRLPTPNKVREREYVQGNLGAIERFKRGFHGSGLKKSIILAYVQQETFDHWHKKICSWIKDLIDHEKQDLITWSNDDLLLPKKKIKSVNKYVSHNSRSNEMPIDLLHYWIYTN